MQGAISFSLIDGGSGYSSSVNDSTVINLIGGDSPSYTKLYNRKRRSKRYFSISLNINLVGSNNVFGESLDTISGVGRMDKFSNTLLSSPDFGFQDLVERLSSARDFRSHSNAVIVLANTSIVFVVNDSLFGVTSGANGKITAIRRAYNSANVILAIDGFKNFTGGELVRKEQKRKYDGFCFSVFWKYDWLSCSTVW